MEQKRNDQSLWRFLLAWAEGDRPTEEEESPIQSVERRPPAPVKQPAAWRLPRLFGLHTDYRLYAVFSVIAALVMGAALLAAALQLPPAGSTQAPDLNEVSGRYLEKGLEETGAVNAVAGMILDYRAFDTFGESTVLFAATMSVVFLLRGQEKKRYKRTGPGPEDDILRDTGRLIFPIILLFGIYVVLNGHLSPGGGFSGGAIMGGGLILVSFITGLEREERLISPKFTTGLTVACLLVYAALKSYSFYTGANHVGWEVPKGTPGSIFSSGFILPLNICVGLIVACTMYTFYDLFAQRED